MNSIETIRREIVPDGKVQPADAAAVKQAATPEQAAALFEEQARQAAALEAAIGGLNGMGSIVGLPAMSVMSLDQMTRPSELKLARSRMKPADQSDD